MKDQLPGVNFLHLRRKLTQLYHSVNSYFAQYKLNQRVYFSKEKIYKPTALLIGVILLGNQSFGQAINPAVKQLQPLHPLTENELNSFTNKSNKEVFGFAPYWTFGKLGNVDFNILTTMAYFGFTVDGDGVIDKNDQGYITFKSKKATEVFKNAHAQGTRVVLTLTQMHNSEIRALMDNQAGQSRIIRDAVSEVQKRGIDGINVDFEYTGNPGQDYRNKFTRFVANLTAEMHRQNPDSKVTVSVYASSIKDPKIYDIGALAKNSDGIFMMAYDFAVAGSDNAIPTAPLYGHSSGKYWYDVSTAVEDFLAVMPADKLILGVPWYGYNYAVYQPVVKAQTRPSWTWYGKPATQTYAAAVDNITPDRSDISNYQTGWDQEGQVGYRAYYVPSSGTWRMIFIEDAKSLGIKYDFAKNKQLKGVGIWALGFDDGKQEMWSVLRDKFGNKLADASIISREIKSEEEI